jgi:hypothetical protein
MAGRILFLELQNLVLPTVEIIRADLCLSKSRPPRSRVNFFMNRFRKLGFIQYNGKIRVDKSLLSVVLHD